MQCGFLIRSASTSSDGTLAARMHPALTAAGWVHVWLAEGAQPRIVRGFAYYSLCGPLAGDRSGRLWQQARTHQLLANVPIQRQSLVDCNMCGGAQVQRPRRSSNITTMTAVRYKNRQRRRAISSHARRGMACGCVLWHRLCMNCASRQKTLGLYRPEHVNGRFPADCHSPAHCHPLVLVTRCFAAGTRSLSDISCHLQSRKRDAPQAPRVATRSFGGPNARARPRP